jgi:hypothetical protein
LSDETTKERESVRHESGSLKIGASAVKCGGLCNTDRPEELTVDVVVGEVVENHEDYVAVEGIKGQKLNGQKPVVERWCTTCSEEMFGIEESAGQRAVREVSYYLTARSAWAFVIGVVLTSLLFLLF